MESIISQNWHWFLLIGILIALSKIKFPSNMNLKGKYQRAKLLTKNEQQNAIKIKKVADQLGIMVSCKVRMVDVVEPKTNNQALFNKVSQKHFDFVLHDVAGKVICIIELDDKSHEQAANKKRDEIKNTILQDVGIPLIRTFAVEESQLLQKLSTKIANPLRR